MVDRFLRIFDKNKQKYLLKSNDDNRDVTLSNYTMRNNLFRKFLLSHEMPEQIGRWDDFRLSRTYFDNYCRLGSITPALNFENEVLFADNFKHIKNAPTIFRCQKPGTYQITSSIGIMWQFTEAVPLDTMRSIIGTLHVYKNGVEYSMLTGNIGTLIREESLPNNIVVHYETPGIFLSGCDYIKLVPGDEIDLRLALDLSIFTIGSYTLTGLQTKGYFCVSLDSKNTKQINDSITSWASN